MSSAFGYTYNVQFISSHEIEKGIKHCQIPSKNTFLKSSYHISDALFICDRVRWYGQQQIAYMLEG